MGGRILAFDFGSAPTCIDRLGDLTGGKLTLTTGYSGADLHWRCSRALLPLPVGRYWEAGEDARSVCPG